MRTRRVNAGLFVAVCALAAGGYWAARRGCSRVTGDTRAGPSAPAAPRGGPADATGGARAQAAAEVAPKPAGAEPAAARAPGAEKGAAGPDVEELFQNGKRLIEANRIEDGWSPSFEDLDGAIVSLEEALRRGHPDRKEGLRVLLRRSDPTLCTGEVLTHVRINP